MCGGRPAQDEPTMSLTVVATGGRDELSTSWVRHRVRFCLALDKLGSKDICWIFFYTTLHAFTWVHYFIFSPLPPLLHVGPARVYQVRRSSARARLILSCSLPSRPGQGRSSVLLHWDGVSASNSALRFPDAAEHARTEVVKAGCGLSREGLRHSLSVKGIAPS